MATIPVRAPSSACSSLSIIPQLAEILTSEIVDAETALAEEADIIATQRYSIPNLAMAERLIAHVRRTGTTLLYDIDDDLLHIPLDHPDSAVLKQKVALV